MSAAPLVSVLAASVVCGDPITRWLALGAALVLTGIGLSNWDKPAAACLASRIARGETITVERLRRIEAAEEFLLREGFRQVRVRDHGGNARVEVGQDELVRLFEPMMQDFITSRLAALGFATVTLDPAGYRQGSANKPLVP